MHKPGSTREGWHFPAQQEAPREAQHEGTDRSGQTLPLPSLSRAGGPGLKDTVTFFTCQPQIKASTAPASALFACRSQQHFGGKLCTQTCSVMSEMAVYQFVFSKYFLHYGKFLREQGEAQDNFRLHFQCLDCSTDSLPACH